MTRFNRIFWLFCLVSLIAACAPASTSTTPEPTRADPTAQARSSTPTASSAPTTVPAPTVAPTKARAATQTSIPPTRTTGPTALPPTAVPAATNTQPAANVGAWTLEIEPLASDFRRPVLVTNAGDGSNRLFVVEQSGRIFILENGQKRAEPFLDLRDKVTTGGNEQGLLGLVFHPDYKNNGLFFVDYSRKGNGDNVVERYHVSSDPEIADPNSAKTLLTIDGLEPNHNGGMLAFGPDGYLYIATGDGGGAGDPHGTTGNGQALDTLLGKILRVDVNAETYTIPPDNPFAGNAAARPEIWAYGLRNPWRFSFDRATGDLYIADVGQGDYEEINFQAASSRGGENYGWRIMEGNHCYKPRTDCDMTGLVKPIYEYTHETGCSVTGGYVYRGKLYPRLDGQYLFADYCTGVVRASARDAAGVWNTRQVTTFDDTISSFGVDEEGELYVVGHGSGTIYRLTLSQ